MEGYGLFEDGYVLDVECSDLHASFIALKSHVKPRTNEKDPISKLSFYKTCVIFVKEGQLHASSIGCNMIVSAYCTCKGGLVYLRHIMTKNYAPSKTIKDRTENSHGLTSLALNSS